MIPIIEPSTAPAANPIETPRAILFIFSSMDYIFNKDYINISIFLALRAIAHLIYS
jgi:hypothetical protein